MKRIFFILALFALFLMGCSTTPPTPKTEVLSIAPIGSTKQVIIETKGNVTRIYSINKGGN